MTHVPKSRPTQIGDASQRAPLAPTLVLHGSDDMINPSANGVLLAERIPGAELQLIDGARHSYFEEYRTLASQRVLDFLRRHPLQD